MKLASQIGVQKVDLSIIVISYNSHKVLHNCLSSIIQACSQTPITSETIVVDNNSTDGSAAYVRETFPQVTLIQRSTNPGYAAAVNNGIVASDGRLICILNADTEVNSGALEAMVQFLDYHPDVAVVGPQLLNSDGSLQDSCFRFPTLAMSFIDFFPISHRVTRSRLNGRYPASRSGAPFVVDHPLGACMLVKREAISQVGGMDESYFMYCEEVDWCYRMKQCGWQVFCVPQARVIHVGGQSTSQRRAEMFYSLHRARYKFFGRHYSHIFALTAAAITKIGIARELFRLRRDRREGSHSAEQLELREAYWKILRMPVSAPHE